jgi:hypothetical protein
MLFGSNHDQGLTFRLSNKVFFLLVYWMMYLEHFYDFVSLWDYSCLGVQSNKTFKFIAQSTSKSVN